MFATPGTVAVDGAGPAVTSRRSGYGGNEAFGPEIAWANGFGRRHTRVRPEPWNDMNPFSRSDDGPGAHFDDRDAFVRETIPDPGPLLDGRTVLTDEDHVAVHDVARDVFEERGVYGATFGYNLAKLNRDRRHPGAGFRYATDVDDASTLLAEFTPTTPFCPQADQHA